MAAQPVKAPSYWEYTKASSVSVAAIEDKGPSYSKDDVVCHAWLHICLVYFSDTAPPGGGAMYALQREAYRGVPPSEDEHKPDIIVVRLTNPAVQPDSRVAATKRDCLWIECMAPDQDVPHGWNTVMVEACRRLDIAHPNRMVYLLLACGLKWMIFKWDPATPQTTLQLHILKSNGRDCWSVHPCIHPVQGEGYVLQSSTGQLIINTRMAHSLDYWTMNGEIPMKWPSMHQLEHNFTVIRNTQFIGVNPASFP